MKKQRRKKVKYPSLDVRMNTRIRQEYTDLDYVNELDDTKKVHKLPNGQMVTAREWMSIFMSEWNTGSVPKQANARKGKLHRSKKRVKECTDRNNLRNNDVYGIAKARNLAHHVESYTLTKIIESNEEGLIDVEDAIIDILDKEKLENAK